MFLLVSIDTAKLSSRDLLHITNDNGYFQAYNDDRSIVARLRQRHVKPVTYCHRLDAHTIQLGYGLAGGWQLDDEYLNITITDTGEVWLQRDIYCTLPIYYAYQRGYLIISNQYSAITARLARLTPNPEIINTRLAGRIPPHHRTLYNEIATVEESASLSLRAGVLRHIPGAGRPEITSLEAPAADPHHFLSALEGAFDRLISKRLDGQRTAFEVSGGLDSATLPFYLAKKMPGNPLLGVTMYHSDDQRLSQLSKLRTLCTTTGMELIGEDLQVGRNSPLQRVVRGGQPHMQPLPSPLETYQEPTETVARALQQHGVDTVVTGIGGDELFEHIVDPEAHIYFGENSYKEYAQDPPSYVTPLHLKVMQRVSQAALPPLPLLSPVLHGCSVARNNTYIEYDIWPISQFSDPYLVRFCQGLPAHFKTNKNILRAFYQAQNFPAEFYDMAQNEDFEAFFAATFYERTLDPLIEQLLPQSYTAAKGYIDAARLRKTYDTAVQTRNDVWLYALYCWLCTEIDLAYHRPKLFTQSLLSVPSYS